jgi:K+-transporting ATPase ATPase C chain
MKKFNGCYDDGGAADAGSFEDSPGPRGLAAMLEPIRPALLSVLLLTLLSGVIFPMALAAMAWLLLPRQAGGSLVVRDGVVVGSELIGQDFTGPGYFHPRPSAAGRGCDAASSGGTNLGPANPKLRDGARDDPSTPGVDESFAGVRELAEAYRARNGLAPDAIVPVDAVTRSGSGLDPHISPANAALQVARAARARRMSEESVRRLVGDYTRGRSLGILGEPAVAVLPLNLALDRAENPRSCRPCDGWNMWRFSRRSSSWPDPSASTSRGSSRASPLPSIDSSGRRSGRFIDGSASARRRR